MVLVAAGLVIRSFIALERTDLGFAPRNVLTFRLSLNTAKHAGKPAWARLFSEVLHRAEAVPGARSAGLVLLRPLSGPIGWDYDFTVEGQTPEAQATNPTGNHERVSPGYFRTLGIPVLQGRDFTWADTGTSQLVVIVNESTADRFWPGQSPLGKRLRWGRAKQTEHPWLTVVGVVGDVRYREIAAVRPDLYVPFLQDPFWAMDLAVRTAGDPLRLARPLA
jgi:putative ABC transport system permease protein